MLHVDSLRPSSEYNADDDGEDGIDEDDILKDLMESYKMKNMDEDFESINAHVLDEENGRFDFEKKNDIRLKTMMMMNMIDTSKSSIQL